MKRFFVIYGTVWILLWLALTGFFSVALNDEVYFLAQQKAGVTAQNARFSDADRMTLNRETVLYLAGRGEPSGALSERAEAHMGDVKRLFDIARLVMYGSVAMGFFCLLIAGRRARGSFHVIYWAEMAVAVLGVAVFAFLSAERFPALFTAFHEAVFPNDFWLLDPGEDVLIRVMPEAFFENMLQYALIAIGARWLIGGALITAAHCLTGRKEHQ